MHRAIDIADEFPRAEVTGVDLAPIQPMSIDIIMLDITRSYHAPKKIDLYPQTARKFLHDAYHNHV